MMLLLTTLTETGSQCWISLRNVDGVVEDVSGSCCWLVEDDGVMEGGGVDWW